MLTLTCKIPDAVPPAAVTDTVALPYDLRCRSRLRVTLASGREAGIVLPRGERLAHGDRLGGDDGSIVAVVAAREPLFEARAADAPSLSRAAYHLGNRHVPVEIVDALSLRFPRDRVLAAMVEGLGVAVREIGAAFDPEGGAYGRGGGELHTDDHTHMLDRSAPLRIRRSNASDAGDVGDCDNATAAGLVDPGHGEHRSPRRIHDFTA